MTTKLIATTTLVISGTVSLWAGSAPIYRVTVVDRTIRAVNYEYRGGPTRIDFRGTVLLPNAEGQATVTSEPGRTAIDAHFEHLLPPTRFGQEYLTYVLWAITPEGHAQNLGEIVAGHSDKAHLRVTTDLQAFGLVVTAEPYSAVHVPSDVVVLENHIRPDTLGSTESIQAKYELLPRGHYTYRVPANLAAAEGNGPKVSMSQYHQLLEIYQAQNALQIARAAGADLYAPDTLAKARELLSQAREAQASQTGLSNVVTLARQATETAEDARLLAVQRKQAKELAAARSKAAQAEAQRAQAQAAALTAQTEAAAAHALLVKERAARRQAEAQAEAAAAAPPPSPPTAPPVVEAQPAPEETHQESALRMRLMQQLVVTANTRDTPRGLVVTIPGREFQGARVPPALDWRLARVAQILARCPGLNVEVDGHRRFSQQRARAVRDILVADGLPAGAVTARDFGNTRPLVSNATPTGREENRRVEIVISGDPIGDLPYWAKTYRLRLPPR